MGKRCLGMAVLLLVAAQGALAAPATITKKQAGTLSGEVAPAWRRGDFAAVVRSLSPLVAMLDEERVASADVMLTEQNLPSLDQMLATARLTLAQQGVTTGLPAPKTQEVVAVLTALQQQLAAIVAEKDQYPALAASLPAPKSMEEYHQLFWTAHVLENRLQTGQNLAKYAASLAKLVTPKQREKLSQPQRAALETDFAAIDGELARAEKLLEQSGMALRVARLSLAADLLKKPDLTKERFLAAGILEEDGRLLTEFFKKNDPAKGATFLRAELNDAKLVSNLEETLQRGRKLGGDLVLKAKTFSDALHWWARGRYGRGPEGWGLLKRADALKSPQASFALFMPKKTPVPTDPIKTVEKPLPDFDRRHHFIWAWETQSIDGDSFRRTSSRTLKTFAVDLDYFY